MALLERALSKLRHDGPLAVAAAIPPYLGNVYANTRQSLRHTRYDWRHDVYNVYEEEWDLLIVLDACRYDVMEEVRQQYDFTADFSRVYSPASSSREWLQANFGDEYADEMASTAYVSGNPFTQEVFDGSEFGHLDEVWRYAWDDSLKTIPPRPLTDRTIEAIRGSDFDRYIVHYMQPHFPILSDPELGGGIDREHNRWINTVWNAYRQNLLDVLEEVELLLDNVDAESVVVTADHGNGFGEDDIYGHPGAAVHDVLRAVPWIRTTAADSGTYEPDSYDTTDEQARQETLSALGYLEE